MFRRVLVIALLFSAPLTVSSTTPAARCSNTRDWEDLARAHLVRYPRMEVTDLYKLLHQATMGSEHAAPGRKAAVDWMTNELRTMGSGPVEPLVDTLGHSGRVVRVHLRPFIAQRGNTDSLLNAFLATATAVRPDTGELGCAIRAVLDLSGERKLPWASTATAKFFATQAAAGYPARHHSEAYSSAYRPAYRVISRQLLKTLH